MIYQGKGVNLSVWFWSSGSMVPSSQLLELHRLHCVSLEKQREEAGALDVGNQLDRKHGKQKQRDMGPNLLKDLATVC